MEKTISFLLHSTPFLINPIDTPITIVPQALYSNQKNENYRPTTAAAAPPLPHLLRILHPQHPPKTNNERSKPKKEMPTQRWPDAPARMHIYKPQPPNSNQTQLTQSIPYKPHPFLPRRLPPTLPPAPTPLAVEVAGGGGGGGGGD